MEAQENSYHHVDMASVDNGHSWKGIDELDEKEINALFEFFAYTDGSEEQHICENYACWNAVDDSEIEGRRAYLMKMSQWKELCIG